MTSSRRRALAFPAVLLGIVFFGLNLLGALANGGALLSLFTFVPLLPVNALLRQYHRDERIDLRRMDRLTIWHVLIMVLGGLFLLLALVGLGMREARSL